MINYEAKIAARLQKIPENKLTREIIIPVLESQGYQKIEFFGGPAENGKDLVFWDIDKMGEVKLFLAAVKHFKLSNTAADKKSLLTVVNQVSQCFSSRLPYTDQNFYAPTEVYVISSFPIDTQTLLATFGNYQQLKDRPIKIIDGLRLAKLILQFKPELVKHILGLEFDIAKSTRPVLNNRILLAALGFREEKDIKTIYTDIDFSLGKISTQLFFNSGFKPFNRTLKLKKDELLELKKIFTQIQPEYNLDFMSIPFEQVEGQLPDAKETKAMKEKTVSLEKLYKDKLAEFSEVQNQYYRKREEFEQFKRDHPNDKSTAGFSSLQGSVNQLESQTNQLQKVSLKLKDQLQELTSTKIAVIYKFELIGRLLAEQITAKRLWMEERVAKFNKKQPGSPELREFILRCTAIIDASAVIFKNIRFFNCIGIEENKVIRKDFEATRFKLPIEQAFDTGLNFAVLGEAGAGKTTCLQMYFFHREDSSDKLIFWIPLAGLVQHCLSSGETSARWLQEDFEKSIHRYLNHIGIQIDLDEFLLTLKTRPVVFLFDGIDEAIKPAPSLPKTIGQLAERYKENIQVVVTSRMSGEYLSEIPFFAITLLPFTPEQRDRFIAQWFHDDPDPAVIDRVKKHLEKNPAIADIITNPLLATTLCVLAKHKLPLPRTEINMYNDRIKLLTGHYDNMKMILSRVTVTPQTLELFAQKLAFYFHTNNIREEYMSVLNADIRKITQNEIDADEAKIALRELADPCNLLVPMTEDGKFGFGHLRYQEHLAAKELVSNRGIEILPMLKQEWWYGVLILFARMNQKLSWLIKAMGDQQECSNYQQILEAMIATRPKAEQVNLDDLFKKYLILEGNGLYDTEILDIDEFDD